MRRRKSTIKRKKPKFKKGKPTPEPRSEPPPPDFEEHQIPVDPTPKHVEFATPEHLSEAAKWHEKFTQEVSLEFMCLTAVECDADVSNPMAQVANGIQRREQLVTALAEKERAQIEVRVICCSSVSPAVIIASKEGPDDMRTLTAGNGAVEHHAARDQAQRRAQLAQGC